MRCSSIARRARRLAVGGLRAALLGTIATAGMASAGDDPRPASPPSPAAVDAPSRAAEGTWLDESGTAILGFGLLRVAPATPVAPGGVAPTIEVRYEEKPTDYAEFDAVQLLALPGDAFASDGRAFADRALAWSRSASGTYETKITIPVRAPGLVVVGFGPFSGSDTSRPLGTKRAYTLAATDRGGVARAWVDAEAGELTVKSWTARPEIARGGPVRDAVDGRERWLEARLEIVYDKERLRAPSDPETSQAAAQRREADTLRSRAKDLREKGKADAAAEMEREADDLLANLSATDDRLPVPEPLAARLRRLPFRWK